MTAAALAWAGEQVGSGVARHRRLLGGQTSTMLALAHTDGRRTVLRLVDVEPWRTHGAELVVRESRTQAQLAGTDLPVPRTLALDPDGERCGHPAHLMTLLSGAADVARADDASLEAMADLLARIHAVVPGEPPRTFQTWAPPAKFVVPSWAERPEPWQQAFEVLRGPVPPYEPRFLHRDFAARNLLWTDDAISGVVDWVETSTGPAWLDVAHARTNLVLDHDLERGEAFAAAYVARTGRTPQPFFDVMDVCGFLPTPGRPRPEPVTDPVRRRRLEHHLVALLQRL